MVLTAARIKDRPTWIAIKCDAHNDDFRNAVDFTVGMRQRRPGNESNDVIVRHGPCDDYAPLDIDDFQHRVAQESATSNVVDHETGPLDLRTESLDGIRNCVRDCHGQEPAVPGGHGRQPRRRSTGPTIDEVTRQSDRGRRRQLADNDE